jgi:hypothetical protein
MQARAIEPTAKTRAATAVHRVASAAPAAGHVAVSASCAAPAAGHVAAHGNGDVSVTSTNRHPDIGDIALATALSWIEFRRVYDFLIGRPCLAQWYSALCARPSMRATTLEGQTHD